MSTIGKITLQSDKDGMVTMQCPRCKTRFKLDCRYLNEELNADLYCPSCGMPDEPDSFYPEEAIDAAREAVKNEAEQMIAQMLGGIHSKHIKIKTRKVPSVNRDLVFKDTEYNMDTVETPCCHLRIGLQSKDIIAGLYCAYCGRIVK